MSWLADAVVYQIYPQSFSDSNGDSIGDLQGVIDKLDYIESLGVDAIWFNPCFESPFVDAGYDVSNYLRVAERYGTNADLEELIAKARERGIRIMLDLVAGHTSIDHEWFQAELHASQPAPEGDRYVWCRELPPGWDSDLPGTPAWVKSPGPRPGWYLKNFYDEQPALNFGWVEPDHSWQDSVTDPGPQRNVEALKEIMDFWLNRGVSGFRIDMAFSLVKGYDRQEAERQAAKIWVDMREWMDDAYPGTVLIPEGSEPRINQKFAFDADFFLVIFREHASLFDNHYAGTLPFQEPMQPYFDASANGSPDIFIDGYNRIKSEFDDRLIMMSSADHDFDRLACGPRTSEQLAVAFAFLLTWGTVPAIWYGDEIGMRYLKGLPNFEGSVCNPLYNRAGCRTPMQWDKTITHGYLPVDPDENRPTVAEQEKDPNSVLNLVRKLTKLRRQIPALRTSAKTTVLQSGYPLVYQRGESHIVAVNPGRESVNLQPLGPVTDLMSQGFNAETLVLEGFGFAILEKK